MSEPAHPAAQACCPPALICPPADPAGCRRRRLWELPPRAHCPVVGVRLSLAALRRLAGKTFGGEVLADDYALHSGAVQDCLQRSPLAEALQRELDRRHALALRRVAALKSTDALRAWWQDAQHGDDLAGALWATLTHARCDEPFEEQVLHDIHLRQHQLGERAVLCVGGRVASVPVYRRLVERLGARFLRHDGGEHDHPGLLDHALASADLVICQTGCIGHDAYWRVKDHCKRTGKRCVFVDDPSRSGLQRALRALAQAEPPA